MTDVLFSFVDGWLWSLEDGDPRRIFQIVSVVAAVVLPVVAIHITILVILVAVHAHG